MPVDDVMHHELDECRGARRSAAVASVFAGVLAAVTMVVLIDVATPAALAAGSAAPGNAAAASATGALPAEQAGFDERYLDDPANIEAGEAVWKQQCRHCHGKAAYPGKAPKLKPSKYTAEFVYDRVTFGFRKMPAWKDVFNLEQRKAVTAYVLSDRFSP